MPRRPAKFTEADVARALKAATRAGVQIALVRIMPDGSILLVPGTPGSVPMSNGNPWDL